MKRLYKILGIVGVVLLASSGIFGQYITAFVDTTHHLIGDHVRLTIRADVERPDDIIGIDLSAFDTSGFEVLDEGKWIEQKRAHSTFYTKDITLTHFDSGYFRIPPVAVKMRRPDGQTSIERTSRIPVMFDVAPVNTPEPAPIKDIYREPTHWTDYLPILYVIAGLLILFLGYWWYKKRQQGTKEEVNQSSL